MTRAHSATYCCCSCHFNKSGIILPQMRVSSERNPLMASDTCWSNVWNRPMTEARLQPDPLPDCAEELRCDTEPILSPPFQRKWVVPGKRCLPRCRDVQYWFGQSDLYILRRRDSTSAPRSALHGRREWIKAQCYVLYYLWRKCRYRILFYYFWE